MFRLSYYMRELISPSHPGIRRPSGPVVIWNILRKCNLACRMCYANSYNKDFEGELSLEECLKNIDELKKASVPALILSGGEPLLHPHFFEIAEHAKKQRFYLSLSTNGILITREVASRLKEMGFDYVGVSLDGIGKVHDYIRGEKGAFDQSLTGIRHAIEHGLKVGIRTTLTHTNSHQIGNMLELCKELGVGKFYLSHLNYGGRGNKKEDAHFEMTRNAMNLLFEKSLFLETQGNPLEIVTGNNDADAGYMLLWAQGKFPDENIQYVRELMLNWGGNASGVGVANIDSQGDVHPDSFWPGVKLGNIKEKSFSEIWKESDHPILKVLRSDRKEITGRCQDCSFFKICNGNTRVRAMQTLNDPWASDPGCYLTDNEILEPQTTFKNMSMYEHVKT